jgi:hypothetical protein
VIERCALDVLLSPGGPVRVGLRPCCLAALVGRRPPVPRDSPVPPDSPAAGAHPAAELVCAAAEAELQATS